MPKSLPALATAVSNKSKKNCPSASFPVCGQKLWGRTRVQTLGPYASERLLECLAASFAPTPHPSFSLALTEVHKTQLTQLSGKQGLQEQSSSSFSFSVLLPRGKERLHPSAQQPPTDRHFWHTTDGWSVTWLQTRKDQAGSSSPLDCIFVSNFHILCFMEVLIMEMKAKLSFIPPFLVHTHTKKVNVYIKFARRKEGWFQLRESKNGALIWCDTNNINNSNHNNADDDVMKYSVMQIFFLSKKSLCKIRLWIYYMFYYDW